MLVGSTTAPCVLCVVRSGSFSTVPVSALAGLKSRVTGVCSPCTEQRKARQSKRLLTFDFVMALRRALFCVGLLVCLGASAARLQDVQLPQSVTLSNSKGFKVVLTPIGATIQNIFVPDCKTGKAVDVALG